MQEQNEQNEQSKADPMRWLKEKMNGKLLFPAGVCCLLLLAGLVVGLFLYRDLPTAQWRESCTDFPWEDNGVSIEQIKCHWQNSQGNSRMELRAAYYPAATITLGKKTTGKGYLVVRFLDDNGTPCGQAIYLPYADGSFAFREDANILTMGREAAIHSEVGYRTKEEFFCHALAEERPLWKVSVWNHAEGASADTHIGYITIPATDKEK